MPSEDFKEIGEAKLNSLQTSGSSPSFLKRYKKLIGLIIGFIFIGVLIVVGWQIFKKPGIPARFSLEASLVDTAGINPQTTFVLKSTQSLNENTIKKILKFEPAIDFDVKKVSQASKLISSLFAQTKEMENVASVFEIKPSQALKSDEIYQAVIADSDYADREYSWAFQVKATFQVVQTHPRHQGTGVPINSGVEIVFNRENLVDPQDYFEISPNVNGTFEQHGNTFVFLPNQLAEKTVYTVKIKKGLKSQGSEDILENDYIFAFETGEKAYTGQKPYFDFRTDFMEFVPDRKPALEVYYYNFDPNNLEINVFKLSDINEFSSSYQDSRQWQLGWTLFYRNEKVSNYQPSENKKILSFKPTIITAGYQKFIEIPQVLEKGYYVLDVKYGERHRQAWLQVTPLARYFSITHDKSLLWLYDFQEKEPIINASVSFSDKASGEGKLGVTNQDGLLEFLTPDSLKEENKESVGPKFFKAESAGYLPFLIKISDNWGYQWQASKGNQYWNYLSTDRYTYQMNDSVKYWGVIKGRDEDIREKKVKVEIYSGYQFYGEFYYGGGGSYYGQQEPPLVSQEILISQFDTIQGELSFKGMSPGFYTLVARLGENTLSSASFQVLTYSKPAYQIIVSPSKNAIFAGEGVDFKIKANFFDGTPVAGLTLKYSGYWLDSIRGEVTLNENGEGNFSYTPAYRESQYDYYPRYLKFTFSPKLSEEGEILGSARVLVFGPSIYLQSFQEKKSDNSYQFTAKLNRIVINEQVQAGNNFLTSEYIGEPVSNYPISAKIIKITYSKIETGQYYDPIDKVVRKNYRYERHEETIEQLSGVSNQSGEWSFVKTLPKEEGSLYKIVFFGQDERGRKIESSCYVYYSTYQEWKEFAVSLNINGESYEKEFSIGDKVRLELEILEGVKPTNAKILFYRYQNSISRVWVTGGLTAEESFEKDFVPSIQYRAVILGPYGFEETNPVTASFEEEDNNLTIDISPEKESYRPGEEVKVNLAVKDKDKKPVSAEVNFSVVDESLFHILPYNWQTKILETLYRNIYVWPLSGASQYAFFKEKIGAGAEAGGCFGKGTPILMSDGSSKPIEEVKVGDKIITFSNQDSSMIMPAIVQGISQHLIDEYLIINDSLQVTPEHKMFVDNAWQYAGNIKIGDTLKGINGSDRKVYSIKTVRAKDKPVYNIIAGKYHTYFAGGYFVHNAEKGGGESMRANFVDVALYKTVQTDSNGQAILSFKAPDNVTAWRATAIAFSSQTMKAGQSVKLIKTSLPLFADVTLSNYYLAGDNPYIRLRAFGSDYKSDEPVEFSLRSESLDTEKKENSRQSVVYLQLGQLPEGEHDIIASIKQGALQDSLTKKIKVVKNYFRKAESSAYNLSENPSDIQGNKDGFTKLIFMDAGRGRFYTTLWWHNYLSGIRADQITAVFFAQKLLAQYFNEPEPTESLDLSDYHTPEGGLGLFPYSDSDLELSAKMADLAPEFVFQDQLKKYFNEALKDKKSDIHRISKALYGLATLKEPVLVKLNLIKGNPELNLEDRTYLALAFAKLGDKESARNIYEEAIRNQLRFQGGEAWLVQEQDMTKRVKLTGTIGVLTSYLNIEADSDSLWNYMSGHDPERELDVLEETLLIKSELAQAKDEKAEFSYKTETKSDSVVLEKGSIYSLTLSEEELKSIKFSQIQGKIKLISFYERSKDPSELVKNSELGLTRKYFVNNQATNSFDEGDIILVRLDPNIAASAIDGAYQVIDYLPSGLKPVTRIYEQGLSVETECDPIWYPTKIIDNIVYFRIDKGFEGRCVNKTINYYARVVSRGSFTANPAIIQSLKDLESLNISSRDIIEIR